MVGVVVTSKLEWDALLGVYGIDEDLTEKYPYGEYYRTTIYDKEVVLFRCPGRKIMSSGAVQYMISKFSFSKVVFLGTSTAVCDYVDYKDVFIPSLVSEYDITIRELEPLIKENSIIELDKVNVSMDYFDGLLGTSDKSLVTNKDYLMTKETDMVASDTEGYAIAKICKMNNVKVVILKGISDRPLNNSNGYEEQFEVYEENAGIIIKNLAENYLTEVL
ncbi:MAG: hypothetical protein IIZ40_04485 [Bacilli bacterium]|nr:hypothetical protein [Bacilli bacterium]